MGGLTDAIESSLANVVKVASPLLASLFGTPVAGLAVSLLANCFGVGKDKVNDLANIILADPEHILKIKQLEIDHAESLAKIASSDYSTEVSDRINARSNAQLYKDFLRHMAYVVTLGFFLALGLLFLPININANARELLFMLVGMLASKWQTIIDFFYGSTHAQNNLSHGKTFK
jgi:hypothetical protein